jgi:aminopeptidase-like protein
MISSFIKPIFKFNRSITGKGTLDTLRFIKKKFNILKIKKIKSGTRVFDWKVPKVWKIFNAYVLDNNGKKIIDFKKNNLHVVNYSKKISKWLNFKDIKKNIFFLKKQPSAIPYVTSYYKKKWGFCLSYNQYKNIDKSKKYFFKINSKFEEGFMNYGEAVIKGKSKKEILLTSYVCHPSMANNELSGPAVLTNLGIWLSKKKRNFSYRILFVPETIGSISYIAMNYDNILKNCIGGYVFSCLGDSGKISFIKSKYNNSFIDFASNYVLKKNNIPFKNYNYMKRGSDERQFCSQGVNLGFNTMMRTKFAEYKEYHTSLDNLNFINEKSLKNSLKVSKLLISYIEKSYFPKSRIVCEPFMTKRNLYPTLNFVNKKPDRKILDVLNYCDGSNNIDQISYFTKINKKKVLTCVNQLKRLKIVK